MDRNLLRQSLRLGVSILITCAIAQHFQRITYIWYPLLAVNLVVDDQDENSLRAARGRILGTVTGGLVTFLVHSIMTGWIGILVSLLITIPLLRRFGWASGISTAVTVTVMFLGIHEYATLSWDYVFNRSIDTLVGIIVALVMGRLLWPKNRLARMQNLHDQLTKLLLTRVEAHSLALQGKGSPPAEIQPAVITKQLLELQRLINVEMSLGPRHVQRLDRDHWRQCLSLWRCQQVRWLLVERLIERLHRDKGREYLPELGRYLAERPAPRRRLDLNDCDSGLSLPQRIALEEQVTRFRRVLTCQQLLNAERSS
ncbi:FUSC family protein [Synechococcus sp. BIOS-U3-1]|uniref:FUSC family protein n=1 Tax=Synechococcus sp. BIOS-U3-1 TaxID=1400865 RepID=UPI002104DF43|nr:aromatic acid exporter family protein [Synechococcus sp. BIOS-U3-1]